MKIAVLISGEYRKFNICRSSMKFLDDSNVDVYVSTWDKTNYNIPKIKKHYNENITFEIIKNDLNRDAIIKIDTLDILSTLPNKHSVPMIYRWKRGIEMIKKSEIDYDYIIITRTDLFFNISKIIESIDFHQFNNTLGSAWSHTGFLNDLFLISNYKKMEELIEKISIDEWVDINEQWHYWWWKYASTIFDNIIDYRDMNFTVCRYFSKKDMSFIEMANIENDWQDLKILELFDHVQKVKISFSSATSYTLERLQHAQQKWNMGHFNQYDQYIL